MPTVATMQRKLSAFRDRIDERIIGREEKRLNGVFADAERDLARLVEDLNELPTDTEGRLIAEFDTVEAANAILATFAAEINRVIVEPGKAWADNAMPIAFEAGREAARLNLDVDFVSPELIEAAIDNISDEARDILTVGFEDTYRIMNVVGEDVGEWFRRETIDAIMEGIPVVGRGETLASRLVEAGRIRPLVIKSQTGRDIRLSITQRANMIARIEMVRVENRAHQRLVEDALGDEAVYINSNPEDSRTTDICERASNQDPMTLDEWTASEFGRPPRLRPFHQCRSRLVGGLTEWFN